MKRRYLWLLGGVLFLALALTALGRVPGRGGRAAPAAPVPEPLADVALEIRDGSVAPATIHVRKGDRLRLTVSNAGATSVALTLPGYEDRLSGVVIGPGARWSGELLADRPGEDFAWSVNGRPAGRLIVQGPHLEEGRR